MSTAPIKGFLRSPVSSLTNGSPSDEFPDRPPMRIPARAATLDGFRKWRLSSALPPGVRLDFIRGDLFFELQPEDRMICLPGRALTSLEGFCDWVDSGEVPEWGRFSCRDNEVVIDVSPEEFETHLKVKEAADRTLGFINNKEDLGEFFPDGAHLTNQAAGLSTEADSTFVSWKTYEEDRVRLIPSKGPQGKYMRMEGSPDWVLEILSRWSGKFDLNQMKETYHRSSIREYWIIDARGEDILFQILVYRKHGYISVRPRAGRLKSPVFRRSFRLTRRRNRMGRWQYTLESRVD